jgi:4-hydroxybenzoate polyprenyltransferase
MNATITRRRPIASPTTGPDRPTPAPSRPAPLFSARFARSYLVTMRPYLLFVSGVTGIAGLALGPAIPVASALVLGTVFFLSYGFGQALTDCFQIDTDALSSPYRPLVRGAVRVRDVLMVSLVGLVVSGVVLTLFNPWNLLLAGLAILGLATYTPFKRRWWAGPFYNAWIVAVLLLIGYASAVGAASSSLRTSPALLGTLACVFFGYANFVLTGYYKDISADRATGYNTLPVVFGLRVSAWVSDLFALLALAGCGLAMNVALARAELVPGHDVALIFLAAGAAATGIAQYRLHRVEGEHDAHRAIAPVVHAYILMLSAVAAAVKPTWSSSIVVFYIGFVCVMQSRPMREQI